MSHRQKTVFISLAVVTGCSAIVAANIYFPPATNLVSVGARAFGIVFAGVMVALASIFISKVIDRHPTTGAGE